jgi:hypothetical protein
MAASPFLKPPCSGRQVGEGDSPAVEVDDTLFSRGLMLIKAPLNEVLYQKYRRLLENGHTMTQSTVIHRVEATDVEPSVSGDLGLLIMETGHNGCIVAHMRRDVFAVLFERMRIALQQSDASAPGLTGLV